MKLSFFLDKTDLILNELNINFICPNPNLLKLCDFCWDIGKITAISLSDYTLFDLIYKNNITIRYEKSLSTINNIIFSSYNKVDNLITIYEDTIKTHFIPHLPNDYLFNSYDLFIKHEFFHFLQCSSYYNLKPYKINFLNEIAAYSFTSNFGIIH